MAKARKLENGYYVVSYRDENGKGRTRSFGKGSEGKKKAELFAIEVDYKKSHGEPLPFSRAEGIYLDELAQLWIDEKKAQGRKIDWLRDWANIFNQYFSPFLTTKPAHLIKQADVIKIISEKYRNCSQSTRNRYIGYIKSILEYGVEQGHLRENALAKWKKGKEERHVSSLTLEDLKLIQEVAPPHLVWALEVAWNIPVRPGPSDLFALRFDRHLKYEQGGIKVYHTKVNKWSFIKLDDDFLAALAAKECLHISHHLIEYKGRPVRDLGRSLSSAASLAGLDYPVCMYDIRHLWITTALDMGIEPSAIAYMAGTSVKMIHKNYYEPHAAEKARVAEVMPKLGRTEIVELRKAAGDSVARVVKLVVKEKRGQRP